MDLTGKVILVTGAAGTGVGAGVCEAIHRYGGRLIVNDLSPADAERAAARYPGARALMGDISDPAVVQRIFDAVAAEYGAIHGLVNNAGIGLSRLAHLASEGEFSRLLRVDLQGLWLTTKAFTRLLLASDTAGSIVNISSVHASATMSRYAIYASAKAGVEGLTRGLAVELGPHRIRCNAVAPGYIHSEQNVTLIQTWADDADKWVHHHTVYQQALEQEITPLDCGLAVVFFLSDVSRCVTGQVLRVDAGTTAMLYGKDFV